MIIIGDHNYNDFLDHIAQKGYSRGLKPRNYKSHPPGYAPQVPTYPSSLLIPQSEQAARLSDQQSNNASLYDLRVANYDVLKSLDQDGYGLCWAFSSTKSTMYSIVKSGEPGKVLSAWYVAGKVKGWRDEGGWGAESSAFIAANGVPTMDKCPSYHSSYDTSDTEQNAALHKIVQWYDGSDSRDQNTQIMISAFLLGLAPVLDFDWLSHSMCGCRLVSLNPLTIDCDNSWGDVGDYGEHGLYRIQGSRAIPDSITVPMVTMASIS